MPDQVFDPTNDFAVLRQLLTSAIGHDPLAARAAEPALSERLRAYERTARERGFGPQVLQVIISARRLVGDHTSLEAVGTGDQ